MPEDPEDLQDDPRGLREAVERSNREAAEARAALADMQRREAFRDAGLNPNDPLHAAVIGGFQGEISEVAAFVAGLGLDQQPATTPAPPAEQEALNRTMSLGQGDGGVPPTSAEAEGDRRLQDIAMQATREKWPRYRFEEEFTAEMQRQNRPVTAFEDVKIVNG